MSRRRSFSVKYKLGVVEWHKKNGESIRKTAGEYGVDRKRVREWINQEEELSQNSKGSSAKKLRVSYGGELISQEIEFGVLDYLLSERERGVPVSNLDLKEKALEIAKQLQDEQPNPRIEAFKASDGWLRLWKRRNRIALLRGTNESQKVPEDYGDLIKEFCNKIRSKRVEHDYTMYNMGNMDQTMCRFDMAFASTNDSIGTQSVRISTSGGAKRGFTVALCALASGVKKPAYICLKERNGVIPARVHQALRIPDNVKVTASANGWMTGPIMAAWINRIWGPNADDVRRLLILDRARIHTMQQTIDQLNERDTDVLFVPGKYQR